MQHLGGSLMFNSKLLKFLGNPGKSLPVLVLAKRPGIYWEWVSAVASMISGGKLLLPTSSLKAQASSSRWKTNLAGAKPDREGSLVKGGLEVSGGASHQ